MYHELNNRLTKSKGQVSSQIVAWMQFLFFVHHLRIQQLHKHKKTLDKFQLRLHAETNVKTSS